MAEKNHSNHKDDSDLEKDTEFDSSDMKRTVKIVSKNRFKIIYALLMVFGIIISLFDIFIGGALVGLSFGLSAYREIRRFFSRIASYTTNEGIFKTAMFVGVLFFFFITVTSFILGVAIGFFIVLVVRKNERHKL